MMKILETKLFRILLLGTISALIPAGVFAQFGDPSALLVYFDDASEIEVRSKENSILAVKTGMELQPGDTVETGATTAELLIEPNGTIIKLSRNTSFIVEQLQTSEENANKFSLVKGKIRSIAARAGIGERYEVSTPSAVCGVRGTDFGLISRQGEEEKAFVAQGTVEYRKLLTDESLTLTSGTMADALAETFEAMQVSREQLNELLGDVQFEQLDPSAVPGYTHREEPDEYEETGLSPGLAMAARQVQAVDGAGADGRGMMAEFLGNYFGFEIGTITMEGVTYSKAVIKPRIEVGKLRMALYLPVIYSDNLLDRSGWYRPEGNDEWSFGNDYDWNNEPAKAGQDLLRDLSLKLHYLEWGERREPFYLKLGNLSNMSLGHGSIMKNYANDADFPAIRRLGLNMGLSGPSGGLETVVNDVAKPDIFGGRLFVTPVGALSFGAGAVTDIDPLSAADPTNAELAGLDSMSFTVGAVDVELPLVEGDFLTIVPFADAAALLPERNGEYYLDMVYDSSANSFYGGFRNYGLSTGILGNIAMIDYTLEYRYSDGLYHHSFFGPVYERIRGIRAQEVNTYLDAMETGGSSEYDEVNTGIYGDASATLFDAFAFSAGYMLPFKKVDTEHPETFGDEFTMTLRVLPDVIPVLGIYGGVTYYRRNFIPMITGSDMSFFDAYADFKGELVYPLAPIIDLAAVFSTSVKHDEDGDMIYKNGKPEMTPLITIETRISF